MGRSASRSGGRVPSNPQPCLGRHVRGQSFTGVRGASRRLNASGGEPTPRLPAAGSTTATTTGSVTSCVRSQSRWCLGEHRPGLRDQHAGEVSPLSERDTAECVVEDLFAFMERIARVDTFAKGWG